MPKAKAPNRYAAGRRAEWKVRDQLREAGYIVVRSAGSKGPYDLLAIDHENREVRLIQVKRRKVKGLEDLTHPWHALVTEELWYV